MEDRKPEKDEVGQAMVYILKYIFIKFSKAWLEQTTKLSSPRRLSHIHFSLTETWLLCPFIKGNDKTQDVADEEATKKTLKLPDGALDPVAFPSSAVEKDPYLGAEEILAVVYLLLQIH